VKRTFIVSGGVAAAELRLEAARGHWNGTEIRSIEQVAARLAGGFLGPVESDTLAAAAGEAVREASALDLGDLHGIADLPGLPSALAATLTKAWSAGIDLTHRAAANPAIARLASLARLEAAVIAKLPPAMTRPSDLVSLALSRIDHSPAVLGPVECRFLPDLAPCWRPLILGLAGKVEVTWNAGPRPVPAWVRDGGLRILTAPASAPEIRVVTCATARHEVIEAVRWARGLLASGIIQAQDISFAAAAPGEFDDLVLAIGQEANLDIHFGHGRRALTTRDGQTAAALADILLRGLSQDRVRRLARMAHDPGVPFGRLPADWAATLPRTAPLCTPGRWRQALATGDAPAAVVEVLLPAIDLLDKGPDVAAEAGEVFLRGVARLLWRRALARAPASALETTLAGLRVPDPVESGSAIGWMHASALAGCPRPYVWLLGLNARDWPRRAAEDPLLPSHIIPLAELDPLPVAGADRAAFHAILATTTGQLTCCASRRDTTGRLLGLSPLLPEGVPAVRLRRARIPEHAMSEHDRMMARPGEFAMTNLSGSAWACWRDWNAPETTAHDGLVRAGHPVLARALNRVHSATSLKMLLRNPLGFAWRYVLGWREPDIAEEAMDLEALSFGNLVHAMLDSALPAIEANGGLGTARPAAIAAAVTVARAKVAAQWEAEQPVPPAILWAIRLEEAQEMARQALSWPHTPYPGQKSYGELTFGDPTAEGRVAPCDMNREVTILGTGLRILGRIDRLDIGADGKQARVVDYKTGKPPRDLCTLAGGGSELQRCLYACAVKALLGPKVDVEAALLYPRDAASGYRPLEDTSGVLRSLTEALLIARDNMRAGLALSGPDTGGDYDGLRFALPASPGAMIDRKRSSAKVLLGHAAVIWDVK
jgi:RecB family exonuclease